MQQQQNPHHRGNNHNAPPNEMMHRNQRPQQAAPHQVLQQQQQQAAHQQQIQQTNGIANCASQIKNSNERYNKEIPKLQEIFNFHKDKIDQISRRVYDGVYQLIKIKFGYSDNNSENLKAKYDSQVQDKLNDLQSRAAQTTQQKSAINGNSSFNNLIQQPQDQQKASNQIAEGYEGNDILANMFPHKDQPGQKRISGAAVNGSNPFGGATGQGTNQSQGVNYYSQGGGRQPNTQLYPGQPQQVQPSQNIRGTNPFASDPTIEVPRTPNPVQLSDADSLRLQEQTELQMMEKDRQLESSLVTSLVQLDAHKQSLLQVISKLREQAIASELRQKKFIELLQQNSKHQQKMMSDFKNMPLQSSRLGEEADESQPFDLGTLFAPVPMQNSQCEPMPGLATVRQGSFFQSTHSQHGRHGWQFDHQGQKTLPNNTNQQQTDHWLDFGLK